MSYPRIAFDGRFARYFSPPSLGQTLFLLTYWVIILIMLWSNVILSPSNPNYASRWEIVGFRAAWVTVTQLPLLYLLAGKFNMISLLTGISYERLNWFHRWVARTMFLTAIVHWSFFFREWSLADFVSLEIQIMPMVKWGFASWGVLGWMVLTSFGLLRSKIYELWILQHLVGAAVLLWVVHTHIPDYARYNVYMAIAFVALDRIVRVFAVLWRNTHTKASSKSPTSTTRSALGFQASARKSSDDHIHVTIERVDFKWKAGQHIYISIPSLAPVENHPFTIVNIPEMNDSHTEQNLELYIKVRQGITKKLAKRCDTFASEFQFRAFLSGPWGQPPSIDRFESLILLATGSGVSFTLPILSKAVQPGGFPRKICFVWVVRKKDQIEGFRDQIARSLHLAADRGLDIEATIYYTTRDDPGDDNSGKLPHVFQRQTTNSTVDTSSVTDKDSLSTHNRLLSTQSDILNCEMAEGRPVIEKVILPVVEQAGGETGVLACGNPGFLADVRNYCASLSNDRAVHKGSGAQGIYVFTECRNG